jgi:hypothetical protein
MYFERTPIRRVRSTRTRLLFVASIAMTSLSLGVTGASAGFIGTCEIEYSPNVVFIIGDQDPFAPITTYNGTVSGFVSPATMWQWISLDSNPWVEMAGGFTPPNISTSTPTSSFDLTDSLDFYLGVTSLEIGESYQMNVAYTTTSQTPSENSQAVLCRTSITIFYFDTEPEFVIDAPDYLTRTRPAVTALPDTL